MNQCYFLARKNYRILFFFLACFGLYQTSAQPIISFHSVASGLSAAVDVVNAGDNTNRIFVVQQAGTIKVFDQSLNPLGDFLTVTGNSYNGGERGLLSMAFHPDYKNNGYFFVYYTNTNGDVEVARYHTPPATPNVADPASRKILLTIPHPVNNNHNGGKLNFGPDGYLYFATGDGGGGGDGPNNAQNGTVLLGKMVRINVSANEMDPAPYYTIPPDNPFLAAGDNIRDEIWAFGLRNPFRWSFDKLTHDMWIGDVGQDLYEEIDFRAAGTSGGLNYGWHCIEGTHPYAPANPGCILSAGVYAPPLFDYPHNNATGGFAVIGGFVYRGTLNPAMYGYYIFADEVSSNVWLLPTGGTGADTIEFRALQANISSFGEAENGELYATSLNGQLYNIVATGNAALPVKLISFEGAAREGYNQLNWLTSGETQLRQFEIEYSTDAVHFQQAGIVAAANSGAYSFKHLISTTHKLYYRLKMVDIDGKFIYSNLIIIAGNDFHGKNFASPSLISNGLLYLRLESSFSNLQIINMDGKVIHQEAIANRTGNISISIAGTPAGQYLVRLYSNDKQLTQKIVVQ
ncbi:MAG: PQQ-dependent sugar dehydrogenase [Bacteroidota bacterium]